MRSSSAAPSSARPEGGSMRSSTTSRACGRALLPELAAVALDPARGDREAEPRAGVLRVAPAPGDERLEERGLERRRHAGAVVLDGHDDRVAADLGARHYAPAVDAV